MRIRYRETQEWVEVPVAAFRFQAMVDEDGTIRACHTRLYEWHQLDDDGIPALELTKARAATWGDYRKCTARRVDEDRALQAAAIGSGVDALCALAERLNPGVEIDPGACAAYFAGKLRQRGAQHE